LTDRGGVARGPDSGMRRLRAPLAADSVDATVAGVAGRIRRRAATRPGAAAAAGRWARLAVGVGQVAAVRRRPRDQRAPGGVDLLGAGRRPALAGRGPAGRRLA